MSFPTSSNTYLKGVITIPSALEISNISKANNMVVTAVPDPQVQVNTYVAGQAVRLSVPANFGMTQADGLVGTILSINGDEFTLNINSSLFDTFIDPSDGTGPATMAPNGGINLTLNNSDQRSPFQSYNNVGN